MLSGDVGVYLDKIESPEAFGIKLYSEIGKPFPLHSTGMGKILLAGMESAEVRRILAGELEAYTPHTITKPGALRRELAKVRRCGYALDREEITRGIVCVAAPIRNGEGDTVAAISIAFPAYINEERKITGEIAAVTRCASEVTRLLAGTPGGDGASRRDVGRCAPAAKKRG